MPRARKIFFLTTLVLLSRLRPRVQQTTILWRPSPFYGRGALPCIVHILAGATRLRSIACPAAARRRSRAASATLEVRSPSAENLGFARALFLAKDSDSGSAAHVPCQINPLVTSVESLPSRADPRE